MAIRTLIDPGDDVLLVEPSFVCYRPIAQTCGANVINIATKEENGFKLTAEEIEKAVTPKTKLLIFLIQTILPVL